MKQQIIELTKQFYKEYETHPSMRALINFAKSQGLENISSIEIYKEFPGGISEIYAAANLPKSSRCT